MTTEKEFIKTCLSEMEIVCRSEDFEKRRGEAFGIINTMLKSRLEEIEEEQDDIAESFKK